MLRPGLVARDTAKARGPARDKAQFSFHLEKQRGKKLTPKLNSKTLNRDHNFPGFHLDIGHGI
jgi:hypothetical protein